MESSPAIGADGTIYVGSGDQNLYAINPDGTLEWHLTAPGGGVVSSPAIGSDGTIYVGGSNNNLYAIGVPLTPTPTPTPNYLELELEGGSSFSAGDTITLNWTVYANRYGFTDVPCVVYLAVAKDPLAEDTAVTVNQIVNSAGLFLFNSSMRPSLFSPGDGHPTYTNVRFPVPGLGSSGSLNFTVPGGVSGRWAFAGAMIRMDNGQFPAALAVIISNGFDLH